MKILTDIMGSLDQASAPAAIKIVLRRLDRQYGIFADNQKRRMRDIHKKNRRLERYVPKNFRYEVQPEHEYIIMKEGATAPVYKSPLDETPEAARERILLERKQRKGG
jgi:hypothetical protein